MAGMPFTGIGGLFYVLCALLLPLRAVGQGPRHRRSALFLAALAVGVAGGIWLAGALLALIVPEAAPAVAASSASANLVVPANVVRVGTVLLGLATLGAILAAVELARVVVVRSEPVAVPSAASRA